MNKLRDTDLREALRRREAKRQPVELPADFLDSVMRQTADTPAAKPVAQTAKVWRMAATVLAAAASIAIAVLLVMPHDAQQGASPTGQVAVLLPTDSAAMTLVAQTYTSTDAGKSIIPAGKSIIPARKSKTSVGKTQTGSPKATNWQSEGNKLAVRRQQTETEPVDSLYNYLSKVEQKLTEIQDSCYEARVERLIRDDARLQQLVIKFALNGILSDTLRTTAQI